MLAGRGLFFENNNARRGLAALQLAGQGDANDATTNDKMIAGRGFAGRMHVDKCSPGLV